MTIITAYASITIMLALLIKINERLLDMRTPESMLTLSKQREFVTQKHETNRIFDRYNHLGEHLGTKWIKTKPSKTMLELAKFVGDRALMPDEMHMEVYGIRAC